MSGRSNRKKAKDASASVDGETASPDFGFLAELVSFHFRMLSIELNRAYDHSFADTPLAGGPASCRH
ncbi:hypothetical protein [Fodinicurvata halophila]|uniref:hypothetical protein n=1 Tax=Fodinicurvata halophila TaxID=1419723 RepID=UPI00362E1457